MLMEPDDLQILLKLHRTLIFFVNQRLDVVPYQLASPEELSNLTLLEVREIRDVLNANLGLIDSFADANPFDFSESELAIVRSWRHMVAGKFFIVRELKKYTVFLSASSPAVAYGVTALSQPFEDMIGTTLPFYTEAVLLPFKDMIVYDSILSNNQVTFGPTFRRNLNEEYKEAKARYGIVTSLPMLDPALPAKVQKVKPAAKVQKVKPAAKPPSREEKDDALQVVIGLVDQFCNEHLNEEYAVLCRSLAEKLGRKRPSPLLQGSPNAWASGIVRAVGGVNFLQDKTQTPYMRSTDIDRHLGTGSSTASARLATIRKLFGMDPLDPQWTLPSLMDDNPLVWMLEINGFMMDVRMLSREIQEVAFNQGLIPYIPADRK